MLWRIFPIQCVVHVYRHVTAPPAGCAYPNPRHAGLAKAILDVPQLVKAFFLEAGTRFDIWRRMRVDARESRPNGALGPAEYCRAHRYLAAFQCRAGAHPI